MSTIKTYKDFSLQVAVRECVKTWAVCGYDNELQRISDFEDMAYGGGNIESLTEDAIDFLSDNTEFTREFLEKNKNKIVEYMAEQAKVEIPYIMEMK
jgi:hypothetical protein